MAVTTASSGTQTATLDTEHTLATTSVGGIYQLMLDVSAMAHGDIIEVRCKANVLSGGTEGDLIVQLYANAQIEVIKLSIPVTVPQTSTWTLTQTDGTARSFPWALLKLA